MGTERIKNSVLDLITCGAFLHFTLLLSTSSTSLCLPLQMVVLHSVTTPQAVCKLLMVAAAYSGITYPSLRNHTGEC